MTREQDIIADFPAYALGVLDDEGRIAVEELIDRDAEAAEELAEMLDTVAEFSARIGEATPPIALRRRLISAANAEGGEAFEASAFTSLVSHLENRITIEEAEYEHDLKNIWQRVGSVFTAGRLAFATSIASFAIVGIMAIQLGTDNTQLNRKVSDMESEVATAYAYAQELLNDMSSTEQMLTHAHERISRQDQEIVRMTELNDALRTSMNDQINLTYATLRNEYNSPDWQPDTVLSGNGYAYLLEHQRRPVGALVVGGVEKAPPGEEYRLYLVREGDEPFYAASFNLNQAGYGTVLFDLTLPLSLYDGAHITRERIADPPDPSLALPENRFKPQ